MPSPLDDPKLGSPVGGLDELACVCDRNDGVVGSVHHHDPPRWNLGDGSERIERHDIGDKLSGGHERRGPHNTRTGACLSEDLGQAAPAREIGRRRQGADSSDPLVISRRTERKGPTDTEASECDAADVLDKKVDHLTEILTPSGGRKGSAGLSDAPQRGNPDDPA